MTLTPTQPSGKYRSLYKTHIIWDSFDMTPSINKGELVASQNEIHKDLMLQRHCLDHKSVTWHQ